MPLIRAEEPAAAGSFALRRKTMTVMYICDRKKYCNAAKVCGVECTHTADKEHALYREHKWFKKLGDTSWEQDPKKEDGDGEPMA